MIRLIAMDMDGTLLIHPSEGIAARNAEALRQAAARGVKLAICSGRTTEDASYFALDAGLDMAIMGLNGAYCLDCPLGQCVANHTMPEQTAWELVAVLDQYPQMIYGVFSGEDIVLNFQRPDNEHLGIDWGTHLGRSGRTFIRQRKEGLDQLIKRGVNKIVAVDQAMTGIRETVREKLNTSVSGMAISSSWINNLEIMPTGVDKGTAVAELAQRLGIPMGEVMTLGDNDNDIPMLACAGYGVAMANATPGALAAAKYRTTRFDEYGVAAAIETYVLKA